MRGSMLMALAVVYLVSISAESAVKVTQVDKADSPPKVENVSFPTWNRLEPSWNRRGTVLRIAFCGMEPSGTVVEPSWNRPVCCVSPHARHIPTALIIILLLSWGSPEPSHVGPGVPLEF